MPTKLTNKPVAQSLKNDTYLVVTQTESGVNSVRRVRPTLMIDDTLSVAGKFADAKAVGDALADIVYQPVEISSFSVTPTQAEKGSTIAQLSFTFALNKIPDTLDLDGYTLTPAKSGTIALTGQSITDDKTLTLTATDNGSPSHAAASSVKTAKLTFLNRVYWGAAAIPEEVDSEFVLGLSNNALASSRERTLKDITAADGLYIWIAMPTRFVPQGSTCTFTVDGFSGGFQTRQTIEHTNASGYAENYYVYRSDNAGLGTVTVVVS